MENAYPILIVDDDPEFRRTLVEILKINGFSPTSFSKGEAALGWVKEFIPSVALIDLRLEDMSGLELLQAIHKIAPTIACIVLTGYASQASAIEAINLGAYSYVQKPFDIDQLMITIRRAIEKQIADQSLRKHTDEISWLLQQAEAEIDERRRAEDAMRDSETRYRQIFESAAVSIWEEDYSAVLDILSELRSAGVQNIPQHLIEHPDVLDDIAAAIQILDVNEAAVQMYGAKSKAELIGSVQKLYLPETRDILLGEIEAILNGERIFEGESINRTLDGRTLQVLLRMSIPTENAQFEKVLLSIIDITERKHQEEQIKLQASALAATANAIIITNQSGEIQWVNPAFTQLSGYDFSEVVGKTPRVLKSNLYPHNFYQELWDTILLGETWRGEIINRHKEGHTYPEEMTITPVHDESGKISHFIAVKQNILGRKVAEEEIRRRNLELTLYNQIIATATTSLNADQVLQTSCEALANILDFDHIIAAVPNLPLTKLSIIAELSTENRSSITGSEIEIQRLPLLSDWLANPVPQVLNNYAGSGYLQELNASLNQTYGEGFMAPLLAHNQIYGVLLILNIDARDYSKDEISIISNVAAASAQGVETSRLYEDAQRRAERLAIINQIGQALGGETDLETICNLAYQELNRLVDTSDFGVFEVHLTEEILKPIYLVHAGERRAQEELDLSIPIKSIEVIREVVERQQPIVVSDLDELQVELEYERLINASSRYGPRSLIIAPLASKDTFHGVLILGSEQKEAYSPEDMQLIAGIAGQIALAIQNADLFEEIRLRLNELETLSTISNTIRSANTMDELLPSLLAETVKMTSADNGAIFLVEDDSGDLVSHCWHPPTPKLVGFRHAPGEGITGLVAQSREIYISSDLQNDARIYIRPEEIKRLSNIKSQISVPMQTQDLMVGVLHIGYSYTRQFSSTEIGVLSAIAQMAASAIHRTRLHSSTEATLQRMAALRNIDIAISASLDLRVTLNILLEQIITQLKVDAAAVLLYEPQLQVLEYSMGRGFYSSNLTRTSIRLGQGLAGKAAHEQNTLILEDLEAEAERFTHQDLFSGEKFVSYCAVPLITKGNLKGVLEVFNRTYFKPSYDWLDFLETLAGQAAIAIENATLYENARKKNLELHMAYDATIEGWSKALEFHDYETKGHSDNVTELTLAMARKMHIPSRELIHIRWGALLHDIGKMGIPSNVLNKKGPLSDEEWILMRKHPKFAYDLLAPIAFLRQAIDIPYCHHEWWNGNGYPRGLKGEAIPLSARIFTIIDVWDALRSDRPYSEAWTKEEALKYIREQSGTQFDPRVVATFLTFIEEWDGQNVSLESELG